MKAARLESVGNPLALRDIDVPHLPKKGALVKVKAAGVCHSDVHLRDGGYGKIDIVKDLGAKLPITLGHEIAGIVEEVGQEVKGFSSGDRVVVDPWIGDGTCKYCLSGQNNLCDNPTNLGENTDGGYAELVMVPDASYLAKTNMNLPEAAPLSCSGLTVFSALKKASLNPSMFLLLVGAGGGLGSMAIQLSKLEGVPTVIGVDTNSRALSMARSLGADFTLDVRDDNFKRDVKSVTDGYGPDVIIDFNSSTQTLAQFIPLLAKGGKYIMVGLYGGRLEYDSPFLINYQKQIATSVVGTLKEFKELIALSNRNYLKSTVTSSFKLEDVNTAIDNLKKGAAVGRQVVEF
jgi:propanol-preferring alcohol dehydrogenase